MNKPVLDYLFGLSGQVAIVTGSTKGIGLAAARAGPRGRASRDFEPLAGGLRPGRG